MHNRGMFVHFWQTHLYFINAVLLYNSAKKIIANTHSIRPYVVLVFTTKKAIPSEDGIA